MSKVILITGICSEFLDRGEKSWTAFCSKLLSFPNITKIGAYGGAGYVFHVTFFTCN